VNKSLQTLLEDESEWKTTIEQKTNQLQTAVAEILRNLNLPSMNNLTPKSQAASSPAGSPREQPHSHVASPRIRHLPQAMSMARETTPELSLADEPESDAIVAPMASLFEVTKLRNLKSSLHNKTAVEAQKSVQNDFISKGKVSLRDAEELFTQFTISLNQYLWGGIALIHDNLTSVRESSSLLSASILAVTALHAPGKEHVFDTAYIEFLALVSESMFDHTHNLDDIRAFAIGAFWLSDVSCKFCLISRSHHCLLMSHREALRARCSNSHRAQPSSKLLKSRSRASPARGASPPLVSSLCLRPSLLNCLRPTACYSGRSGYLMS